MTRGTKAISGWVNFPVDDPAWRNSGEGGMLVKLVVCDNREGEDFAMCCGAHVFDVLCESFVGDDRRPQPVARERYDSVEDVEAEQRAYREWEGYHFPHVHDREREGIERELSRDYLAVLVLGTTGWSGWHRTEAHSWQCRFEDLTEDGQALYRQIEKLYPGCELHLLTFIDT